jgi:hypothetical protein
MFCPFRKYSMGTDLRTTFAVDTPVLIIPEGSFCVRIKHQITPIR